MRTKILLPNLLVVLTLGVFSYFFLKNALAEKSEEELRTRIQITSGLFDRSETLRGQELVNEVRRQAMSSPGLNVFGQMEIETDFEDADDSLDKRIRSEWFRRAVVAVETFVDQWKLRGRVPALAFITDRRGVVLARNTTAHACPTGERVDSILPIVKQALSGEAGYTLLSLEKSPFDPRYDGPEKKCSLLNTGLIEAAAAPIWSSNDEVAGVLVVGFDVSNGVAAEKSALIDMEVAVIAEGRVYSSSLGTDESRLALSEALFTGEHSAMVTGVMKDKTPSDVFQIEIGREGYLVRIFPSPHSLTEDGIALVYLESLNKRSDGYLQLLLLVAVATALAAVLIFFTAVALERHFVRPIIAVEEGLLRIINGEQEFRFDVKSSEIGGLAYRINQLVGALTGKDESGEDDNSSDS